MVRMTAQHENEILLESLEGSTIWLTLNRPQVRNALNEDLVLLLRDRIEAADANPDVRVVVIRGSGPGFCAGGDFGTFDESRGVRQTRDYTMRVFEMFHAIEDCSKPVIAAPHGFALAGGTDICLAADLVVTTENCVFGMPEAKIGLTAGFGGMRLPSVVGLHNAKYLLLTGRRIDATEARRMGLVNVVCPEDQLVTETRALAEELAANAPLGMAAGKAFLNQDARQHHDYAVDMVTMLQMTEDRNEGLAAFREKRSPRFTGR